ncbi:MAG: ABC transporter permease [Acidobacteriota bacterium]
MTRFLLRRLAAAGLLLVLVLSAVFVLLHFLPGQLSALEDPRLPAAQRELVRHAFGLDRPLATQYLSWMRNALLRFDWGTSFTYKRPVLAVLGEALPASALLAAAAIPLQYGLGLWLGVWAARRAGGPADHVLRVLSLTLYSLPVYWLGILAILLFALHWPLLPAGHMHSAGAFDLPAGARTLDLLRHLILPALVLAATNAGGIGRFVRNALLEQLGQDYVRAARARGLSEPRVLWRHALRNALPPLLQAIGTQLPALLAGVLAVEVVFAWPGMGRLAYDAMLQRDLPLVLGWTTCNAILVLLGGLLADALHAAIDPRIREQSAAADPRQAQHA